MVQGDLTQAGERHRVLEEGQKATQEALEAERRKVMEVEARVRHAEEQRAEAEALAQRREAQKEGLEAQRRAAEAQAAQEQAHRAEALAECGRLLEQLRVSSVERHALEREVAEVRGEVGAMRSALRSVEEQRDLERRGATQQAEELTRRLEAARAQQELLHRQLEAGTGVGVAGVPERDSELREVVRYLRHEAAMTQAKLTVAEAELVRLRTELDLALKTRDEARAQLRVAHEQNAPQLEQLTALRAREQAQVAEGVRLRKEVLEVRAELSQTEARLREAQRATTQAHEALRPHEAKRLDLQRHLEDALRERDHMTRELGTPPPPPYPPPHPLSLLPGAVRCHPGPP